MYILAIETSCDETAASVASGKGNDLKIISNVVSSQINIHKKYGGVIPELAAREHVINIIPVIDEALALAKIKKQDAAKKLSAIAVTIGPGLITSLMVGVETAKTLAYAWKLPIVAVNHIEGHIYSNFINNKKISFPAIILTVSGGHTQLVLLKSHLNYKTIGETRDDAAGEAFDKAAQLLGLGYPGGPIVSKQADKFSGKHTIHALPRPMLESKDYDFSFSGLKTALLYATQKDNNFKKKVSEYAFEFQEAVVDVLTSKTIRAAKEFKVKSVFLSGGVSANKRLREKLATEVKKIGLEFAVPEFQYTTDNAAMIASAGYFKFKAKKTIPWQKIKVDPNLEL
jgi:N6-L-threonylcarbamoyladenine synthase